jgi:hypothetical protein
MLNAFRAQVRDMCPGQFVPQGFDASSIGFVLPCVYLFVHIRALRAKKKVLSASLMMTKKPPLSDLAKNPEFPYHVATKTQNC